MTILAASDLLFGSRIQQASEAHGLQVAFAPRDSDVLGRAREIAPTAVLIDLASVPDGPALVRSLKAEPALAGTRIIGYLGHTHVDLFEAARAAGADQVLAKGELTRRLPELMRELAARPGRD